MIHQFTIPFVPKPQSKPRFARQGNVVITYEDKAMTSYKKEVAYAAKRGFTGKLIGEPIKMEFMFYLPIPKSATKKFRKAAIQGKEKPIKKPDIDNLVKAILDAIYKVVIQDDCLVIEIRAQKIYSENPRTEVVISPVKTAISEK